MSIESDPFYQFGYEDGYKAGRIERIGGWIWRVVMILLGILGLQTLLVEIGRWYVWAWYGIRLEDFFTYRP